MNDMLGTQWSEKATRPPRSHIKRSETMANGKCTCCLIVIRRLSPRKYLTEYRHFCNQGKTHTLVQQTSHSAENYIAQNCGRSLKRKFTNDKMYWVCNTHFQNAASCPTPPYHTPDIEQAFCRMYYKLKHHGDPIFTQMLSNLQKIRYSRMLWQLKAKQQGA